MEPSSRTVRELCPLDSRSDTSFPTYLNIPWKYYDRMCQENIGLLAQNVNTWLQKEVAALIDGVRHRLDNGQSDLSNVDVVNTPVRAATCRTTTCTSK